MSFAQKEQEKERKKLEKIAQQLQEKKQLKVVNLQAGKGGFGNVMIVQDASLNLYAVKVISIFDGVDDISEEKKEDAEEEAKILENCDHPSIVKSFGSFQIGFNYFILMEKCEMSLQDFVDKKMELTRDLFINFALETIQAVKYLHSKNLVLRDISLKNILLDKQNRIKLCDFGLVKQINPTLATQAFLSSNVKGVCFYLPPEILEMEGNEKKVYQTREGDIWAFGICLYFLFGSTLQHVLSFTQGLEAFKYQKSLGEDLNNFVELVLQKNPKNRPNVEQIIESLTSLKFKSTNQKTGHNEANTHFEQGVEYYNKKMFDDAIGCYKIAIQIDPKNASYHSNLGIAYKNKNMLDDAIGCYKIAIQIDPKNASYHSNLGIAYKKKNMLDDAIGCYKIAIQINPKNARYHYNLGNAYDDKKMFDDAIGCYKIAIQIDPKDASYHSNLGIAYYNKNMLEDAIGCYKIAIQIDPKDASYHSNLGIAYKKKNMLDDAIGCYKIAIQINPKQIYQENLDLALKLRNQKLVN